MVNVPLTHPNLSFATFSGKDPNQRATTFWISFENIRIFSLGQTPSETGLRAIFDTGKTSLFGSFLTETSLEWCNGTVVAATTWDQLNDLPKPNH